MWIAHKNIVFAREKERKRKRETERDPIELSATGRNSI